jgi:short-subunit dehydrogenase
MSVSLKPIRDQVMVITGASSGIGLATVQAAAERGAKLVLAARSERTLSDIVARINAGGGDAIYVVADVADREQVQRIADQAIAKYGRIDTWVNDAGVSIYGMLDEVSEEDSRRMFDTNFWGVVNGSLVALPYLKQSHGALLNVGSEVSDAVVPLQGMYSASKHAVKGFTDALRVEQEKVARAGIAITLIQPTAVDTPYPQHARNYTKREPKLPSPQISPERVAAAILDAAEHHRRDVKVGLLAKVNTLLARVAPHVSDFLSALQANRQHYDEPPRAPRGTLREPGVTGQINGSGAKQNGHTSHTEPERDRSTTIEVR